MHGIDLDSLSPRQAAAAVRLVATPIDTAALLAEAGSDDAGATVLFVGTTRRQTGGSTTAWLEYEAHHDLAAARLVAIREEAMRRFGLRRCLLVHRLGRVGVGEASVAVVASSAHRREAFAATEWLMEALKRSVPIWKCEGRDDGSWSWVHEGGRPEP